MVMAIPRKQAFIILTASGTRRVAKETERFDLKTIKVAKSLELAERLWSVEQQIVRLSFEVAFLFRADGQELFRLKGDAKAVEASDEQKEQLPGGYLTHNHPDGSFFSLQDIQTAHRDDLAEIRVIANRPTPVLYILRRPAGGWNVARFEAAVEAETKRLLDKYPEALHAPQQIREAIEQAAQAEWIKGFPDFLKKLDLQCETLPL